MTADQTPEFDALTGLDETTSTLVIPVLREVMRIERRQVETGLVRVRKTVSERDDVVEAMLMQEGLHVERIPIDRVVTEAPAVREEGDVTIIPVMEEVLVVEKRLVLKEELRIRRSRGERPMRETMRLRTEEVAIEQTPASGLPSATPSAERKED